MTIIKVNMKQFREKFKWFAESCEAGDSIAKSKGSIVTLDARKYTHWLNLFSIFYTMKG